MMIHVLLIAYVTAGQTQYASETPQTVNLKNTVIEVSISKTSGMIRSIIIGNHNVLQKPCSVQFDEQSHKTNAQVRLTTMQDDYPESATVTFTTQYNSLSVQYQYTIDTLAVRWDVTVTNSTHAEKEERIDFILPVSRSMEQYFHSGLSEPRAVDAATDIFLTYRQDCYIPMITGFSVRKNYGLSVIAPFEIRKPGVTFSITNTNFAVSYHHLLLSTKKEVTVGLYIVPHAGCWRPGLRFALRTYPEYFHPAVEKTNNSEGWFYLAYPSVRTSKVNTLSNRGVTWIELHEYFPFYGLYAPEQQTWGIILDSDEVSLSRWENGAGEKQNSYKNMATLIDLFHTYGIQVYLYMQSAEAWQQFSSTRFPNDIARNAAGVPLPAWKFTNLMNPDPEHQWGQHIIAQAKRILEKYPDVDGIFYDRMDYWDYDFAHADGVTMVDSKPAYMLGFAQEQMSEVLFKFWHQHDKGIWGNGPTSIEVCKNLDGIMAERSPITLEKLQYLCLARPLIYLAYDGEPRATEEKLKNALLHGAFPSISYGDTSCYSLEDKYRHLFECTKNRKWVLTPNPVEVPYSYRGNIFRSPNGDYSVVIVSPEKSQLRSHPFAYNIPITVTIPDANEIENAYLIAGDWSGFNAITFRKAGNSLNMLLPYHLSSSIVYLKRNKRKGATRVSSPILLKGRNENIVFRLDNVDFLGITSVTLKTPWSTQTKLVTKEIVEFPIVVPKDIDGEIETVVTCNCKNEKVSFWVVDPISVAPKEDIFIRFQEGEKIPFYITNNLNEESVVHVTGTFVEGTGTIHSPDDFILHPHESREMSMFMTAKTAGVLELTLETAGGITKDSIAIQAALPFGQDDLFHDDFTLNMDAWKVTEGTWTVSQSVAHGTGLAHFAYVRGSGWQNYQYEVTVRCLGSNDPKIKWLKSYIFFRFQDEQNYYRFGIHGDAGVIDLYKCVDGKFTRLQASPFRPEKDKWYTLRIEAQGVHLKGYIDNRKVLEATDASFMGGGIGIGVLEDGIQCDYSSVVVKKL